MNISPADLAIFIGFFAVVIGLSVWKSRRAKGHVEDRRISSSRAAG